MRHLAVQPGLEAGISRGRPALALDIFVAERATRPLGELAPVAANPVRPRSRRIQYWMLNGMVREADRPRARADLQYDFTYLPDRPIGWERNKTMGHAHTRPVGAGLGFAEVCEILEGSVGFVIQDLHPGPRATFAVLVTARPGQRVILPPFFQHASIHLGGDMAVFSDVICRSAAGIYRPLAEAHGMAWFIDLDGKARPNPAYSSIPPLQRIDAEEWSGAADRPLYRQYVEDPASLAWVHDPDRFPAAFPALWGRVRGTIAALERTDAAG